MLYDGPHYFAWAFAAGLVILVLATLLIGTFLLVRGISNRTMRADGASAPASSGPLRILEERFARGEIDDEEFKRRREVLRGGG